MKIHFISGLPRSGSTMLAAVLRQNPRFFHFGMSSPVCDILMAVERASSRKNEMTCVLGEQQKWWLRKGVFEAIYPLAEIHFPRGKADVFAGSSDIEVVFDTNRLWTAKLPLLQETMPNAKVICCVRHVSWIMDSFERLYRKHPLELSGLYGFAADTTVFTRCAKLAASDGVVGRALDALREGYYGEQANRLMLVDYDVFCADPRATMAKIYDFVGEPVFLHNFDDITVRRPHRLDNSAFDRAIGSPGLHDVRPKVERVSRKTILPPMLWDRFANDAFWQCPEKRSVRASDGL